jgi:hypothetical protein
MLFLILIQQVYLAELGLKQKAAATGSPAKRSE